jgi:hypothetical protein
VLHSTEGPSAASALATFAAPDAGGSTQLVVGDEGAWRCLPDDVEPCGAPGANAQGLHMELVGYASWTRAQWIAHMPMLRCAARLASDWCSLYGIPQRFIDAKGLLAGEIGITTHAEVDKAWKKSTHWDPGPGFPMDVFLNLM